MRNVFLIVRKELRSYFNSPIAYIVIIAFLALCGYFFATPLFLINRASIRHFINLVPLLFLFFIPAITMRTFAEEIKSGTLEIIVTLPVTELEILLAKYLSSLFFLSIILVMTLIYPITISLLGDIDWLTVIGSYIGLFFLGGMFLSIGVFTSILSKNQIIAFILAFVMCFILFILGKIRELIPPAFVHLIEFIGIDSHFENAARGIVDTRDLIYYLSGIFLFLYSSFVVLQMRKWK